MAASSKNANTQVRKATASQPDDEDLPVVDEQAVEEPAAAKVRQIDHESFAHRLYVSDFNIAFIEKRHVWYLISGVLLVVCTLGLIFRGLNLGVEFTGGSVFTVQTAVSSDTVNNYTEAVNNVGLPDMGDLQVTTTGSGQVRVQTRSLDTDEVTTLRQALATYAGIADPTAGVGYQLIGPSWGTQITQKGVQALVIFLALVALMIGVYFRNWKMSVAALIALFHDMIITVGIYALVGFTVTPATLTGLLTILGYSLYDTVVVFDKVRENTANLDDYRYTYAEATNRSVNQVLIRSINTTIIGVLPVAAILFAGAFILGSGPLEDIGLALFVGMIIGAYSSIFIAAPLLSSLRMREPAMIQQALRVAKRREKLAKAGETVDLPINGVVYTTGEVVPVLAGDRRQPVRTSRSRRSGS